MSEIEKRMTDVEQARLAELEAVVERGLRTFVEVGLALTEIRETRLYRETHKTFESYCRERFGFSASRGRQLIAGARTVTAVTQLGLPAPTTEREAREMARRLRAEADALDGGRPINAEAQRHLDNATRCLVAGDEAMHQAADVIVLALNEDPSRETLADVQALLSNVAWGIMDEEQRAQVDRRVKKAVRKARAQADGVSA
jgi:hypothetical protein